MNIIQRLKHIIRRSNLLNENAEKFNFLACNNEYGFILYVTETI